MKSISKQMLQYIQEKKKVTIQQPSFGNTYLEDAPLRKYLSLFLPQIHLYNPSLIQHLTHLGHRFCHQYSEQAKIAERNQPKFIQYDAFGNKIDKLQTSQGWKQQHKFAAIDHIVSFAYQKDQFNLKEYQRFVQLVILYQYQPVSGLYGCPLAMTDGAIFTLKHIIEKEVKQLPKSTIKKINKALDHLLSNNQNNFWTSGQWMTQKKGGSDVSFTQTIAKKVINKKGKQYYRLFGYKWFSSATDANMSLVLAKIIPQDLVNPKAQEVLKIPISLFLVKLLNKKGQRNNIKIVRLKDKLGTRQLPTAELLLVGTKGYLISQPGKGVKLISNMLNITRIYNASTAVGLMRRMTNLARDYAFKRKIGTKYLSQMPLQILVLSQLQLCTRGCLLFYLKISLFLSKAQYNNATIVQKNLLRILTPILKLYTAKQCIKLTKQGTQAFGGLGYLQDSGIPAIQRDAQVLAIWEGTTNVLCLDYLKAIRAKQNPFQSFITYCRDILNIYKSGSQNNKTQFLLKLKSLIFSYNELVGDTKKLIRGELSLMHLRQIVFGQNVIIRTSRIFIGFILLQFFVLSSRDQDKQILIEWIEHDNLYKKKDISVDQIQAVIILQKNRIIITRQWQPTYIKNTSQTLIYIQFNQGLIMSFDVSYISDMNHFIQTQAKIHNTKQLLSSIESKLQSLVTPNTNLSNKTIITHSQTHTILRERLSDLLAENQSLKKQERYLDSQIQNIKEKMQAFKKNKGKIQSQKKNKVQLISLVQKQNHLNKKLLRRVKSLQKQLHKQRKMKTKKNQNNL